ncbi:MAG: tRNA uridine-5-carboxymethylaminomethyl(34) synthesis GTPase MnmE [Chloroflexi bacterium]|nr:tRNA uridine-5-carboxymethylaminomethyl(34) synthesis GTPase MnmE [Chloroflexota bacterium]
MVNDTIAAISTPVGEGGIGIVRLSGDEALGILRKVFVRKGPRRDASGDHSRPLGPWRVHYGHIVDPSDGETVDEVLAVHMAAPNTYTREDVVEISCHGGAIPLQSILGLVLRQGARLAHPGEFTLRAFVNGRIDLAQAESVLDVIRARTDVGLRVAMGQLGGRLSHEIKAVRAQVVEIAAYLTATIDFAEDEIPEQDIVPSLDGAILRVQDLLRNADAGIVYRQGLRTAIVGRPNVGKSSLLNALLRENRAIVTPIPGTTRDTLEEVVNLRGIPIVLVDTAGITETDNVVEQLGVERSRQAIATADLVIFVVDGSQPLSREDREIAALVAARPRVTVVNKSDLPRCLEMRELADSLGDAPIVHASASTADGLGEIEAVVARTVLAGDVSTSDALLVSNPRHKDVLGRALAHLEAARESHSSGMPADFVTIDLAAAANAFGEITGETVTEDLLDNIFSRFCIGK